MVALVRGAVEALLFSVHASGKVFSHAQLPTHACPSRVLSLQLVVRVGSVCRGFVADRHSSFLGWNLAWPQVRLRMVQPAACFSSPSRASSASTRGQAPPHSAKTVGARRRQWYRIEQLVSTLATTALDHRSPSSAKNRTATKPVEGGGTGACLPVARAQTPHTDPQQRPPTPPHPHGSGTTRRAHVPRREPHAAFTDPFSLSS